MFDQNEESGQLYLQKNVFDYILFHQLVLEIYDQGKSPFYFNLKADLHVYIQRWQSIKLQILTKENICAVCMKTIDNRAVSCSTITHVDCKYTDLEHRKQSYAGTCA